jgi:hypothetical protein
VSQDEPAAAVAGRQLAPEVLDRRQPAQVDELHLVEVEHNPVGTDRGQLLQPLTQDRTGGNVQLTCHGHHARVRTIIDDVNPDLIHPHSHRLPRDR